MDCKPTYTQDNPEAAQELVAALGVEDLALQKVLEFENPATGGRLIIGLSNYTKAHDIELHATAKGKWYHKDIVDELKSYIFDTLGCKRVTMKIKTSNRKAMAAVKRYNAIRECKLAGVDYYQYAILPEVKNGLQTEKRNSKTG